jgi:hypothetical protein
MHIAAQVSIGGSLPGTERVKRGQVLFFSAEDDAAYTIRPRIDAMKGNSKRIRFQSQYSAFDDEGLKVLWEEVKSYRPDLIIIDPLVGYVPSSSDFYKPNEIRALLYKINEVAVHCGAALVVVRHLTKGRREKAIYQGTGSIDVIGVARAGMLVALDPDDADLRIVAQLKTNISKKVDYSWAYRLTEPTSGVPELEWQGKSSLTADDLHDPPREEKSALDDALRLLQRELKSGPKAATDLLSSAETEGISERTLARAKTKRGIVTRKRGSQWFWELPAKGSKIRIDFRGIKQPKLKAERPFHR